MSQKRKLKYNEPPLKKKKSEQGNLSPTMIHRILTFSDISLYHCSSILNLSLINKSWNQVCNSYWKHLCIQQHPCLSMFEKVDYQALAKQLHIRHYHYSNPIRLFADRVKKDPHALCCLSKMTSYLELSYRLFPKTFKEFIKRIPHELRKPEAMIIFELLFLTSEYIVVENKTKDQLLFTWGKVRTLQGDKIDVKTVFRYTVEWEETRGRQEVRGSTYLEIGNIDKLLKEVPLPQVIVEAALHALFDPSISGSLRELIVSAI